MLQDLIKEITLEKYNIISISTTSRKSNKVSRLPDKRFSEYLVANVLVTDNEIAKQIFQSVDGLIEIILVDVERKQKIDLNEIAKQVVKESEIIPYKPNDITLEAADQLLLNRLGKDISNKNVLIYGTGNIAFKLALRLLEREVNVSLIGRDKEKVKMLVECLNSIKPRHSGVKAKLHSFSTEDLYDGMISFLSAEKIINEEISSYIKPNGIAIDGGIGNFQSEFIAKGLERNISIFRLDVRLGNPFLLSSIQTLVSKDDFFNRVIGSKQIGSIQMVAGGIIGDNGAVIVDQIKKPTQIIGIANGYGGLKNEKEFTSIDKENLQYAREIIL